MYEHAGVLIPLILYTSNGSPPQVQRSLEESRAEVVQLKAERQLCEENMKKAFMRGVCALNLEAMSVFRPREAAVEPANHHDDVANGDCTPSPHVHTPDEQQAGSSHPSGGGGQTYPKSVHMTTSTINGHQHVQSKASKPSVVTMAPPLQGKSTNGRRGQSSKGPPVVVERHVSA